MRSLRKPAAVTIAAAAALALAACGSSGGSTRQFEQRESHPDLVAQRHGGAAQDRLAAGGHRVPRGAPERDDPGRADPERGVHDQDPARPGLQQPARHLPAVGRRPGGHPGPVRQGRRPDQAQLGLDRPGRRRGPGLAGERQAVRRPLRPAHGRLLVPQGPVRQGRDHRPADHPGRARLRRRQAEGREHRADRGRQQGQVAGRVLVGVLRGPRVPHGHPQGGDEGRQPDGPCFMQAGNQLKAFMATKPFQAGFLGTPSQAGRGQLGGHGRQRQGRDGTAG